MNLKKLKEAQKSFLAQYPGGFSHPEMVKIGKAHKMDKMTEMTQVAFDKKNFKDPDYIVEQMGKIISRSSMVSLFEKPKFKEFTKKLNTDQKKRITKCFKDMLYGKQAQGFDGLVAELKDYKLAKWTLMTILLVYFDPENEVFVKPMTTKGVIKHFEVELKYHPTPSWEFYKAYRDVILEMKSKTSKKLGPNNAAYTGFLMMSLQS